MKDTLEPFIKNHQQQRHYTEFKNLQEFPRALPPKSLSGVTFWQRFYFTIDFNDFKEIAPRQRN